MRRSKTLALVFLVGTLLVGGAAGFTLTQLLGPGACHGRAERQELHDYLAQALALTPAQRASVDSILDKRHRDMLAASAPVRPRLDSIRLAARAEIFKLLDPEQSRRFRQIIAESQQQQEKK
ncbi:MAG: hypothetical protein IRY91_02050 [Gemmatimonadaceae bacterium]|nr:hypothetical protein [Gemmatimonadaceae bacterium]